MKKQLLFATFFSMVGAILEVHDPTKCFEDYAQIRSVNESLCCGSFEKGSQCSQLYNDPKLGAVIRPQQIVWTSEQCNPEDADSKYYSCYDLPEFEEEHDATKCGYTEGGICVGTLKISEYDEATHISCKDGYESRLKQSPRAYKVDNKIVNGWIYTCVPPKSMSVKFDYFDCCRDLRVECMDLLDCKEDYIAFMWNQTNVNDINIDNLDNAYRLYSDLVNDAGLFNDQKCLGMFDQPEQCWQQTFLPCWQTPEYQLQACYDSFDQIDQCRKAPQACYDALMWGCFKEGGDKPAKCKGRETCRVFKDCELYFSCLPIQEQVKQCHPYKDTCHQYYDCYQDKRIQDFSKSAPDANRIGKCNTEKWQTFGRCMRVLDQCVFDGLPQVCSSLEIEQSQSIYWGRAVRGQSIRLQSFSTIFILSLVLGNVIA